MSTTGKIYLKDHNGQSVGIGQDFEIKVVTGGFAAFLITPDGDSQLTARCDTIGACRTALGGVGTVVIDDL